MIIYKERWLYSHWTPYFAEIQSKQSAMSKYILVVTLCIICLIPTQLYRFSYKLISCFWDNPEQFFSLIAHITEDDDNVMFLLMFYNRHKRSGIFIERTPCIRIPLDINISTPFFNQNLGITLMSPKCSIVVSAPWFYYFSNFQPMYRYWEWTQIILCLLHFLEKTTVRYHIELKPSISQNV